MKELKLQGTKEALQSPEAFKLVAAATLAGVPLVRTVDDNSGQHQGKPRLAPPPPASSSALRLVFEDAAQVAVIGSSSAAIRLIGSISPASGLLGSTVAEAAVVDSWLQWTWSNVDLPGRRPRGGQDASASASLLEPALEHLDAHLVYRTYLVGDAITAADISAAASLEACTLLVAAEGKYPNLERWRATVSQQSWWIQSRETMKSMDDAPVTASASASASASRSVAETASAGGASASSSSSLGVELNGPAPPVLNQKYRRPRLRIKELLGTDQGVSYEQQTVTVAGWARTIRKASARLMFVELNDGSTGQSLQCVLDSTAMAGFDECKGNGGTGSSFQFTGVVVKSPGAEQAVDLNVTAGTLLGAVYGGNAEGTVVGGMLYPLSKKEHTLEHLRDVAHLRARGQIHAAAMRIRHAMAYATHHFFHSHGFLYIHTPILTGADCEGAGEQFGVTTLLGNDPLKADVSLPLVEKKEISKSEQKRLEKQKAKADPTKPVVEEVPGAVDYKKDFFGQRVNLTVSGQLNVETHACALCDVYTFGPTFRAEESRTYRHLSEFWMIEPEIAFADLHQDINLAEDYLKYCVKFALENCAPDLQFFEESPHGEKGLRDRLRNVLDNEFKRLTYTEAIEILQKAVAEDGAVFETKPEWGIDLPSEHERYICEKVFNKPVVLTDYPKDIKAFYMKVNEDNKTVAACDILVPKIGEIIGGSQREHRYDVLKARCVEMNLDPRQVWWYLDLRRYGTIPHAGFGLGFERLILFVTGLDNIRDVIPFPRWVGNASF